MSSTPKLLQHDFTAGIRRARARDDLGRSRGANVLWDCRDWIIGRLGVPLGKRGGWGSQGSAMTDGGDTAAYIRALTNDPFNGGNFMRAVDASGKVWRSAGPDFASWTRGTLDPSGDMLVGGQLKQNGVFIADNLFYPSPDGTVTPWTFNETFAYPWPQAPGGAGFYVTYLTTWLNRLVGLDAHENLWFGDSQITLTAWDDDAKYLLGQPGRGLASIGEKLLVFFDGSTKIVSGTTPAGYGITQDDIRIDSFSDDIGIIDAFTICKWKSQIIWADENGVWTTDGATYPLDLTFAGDAKDLYLEFIREYDKDTMRVAAGIYSDQLIVSMTNLDTHEFVDCIVCDLPRRVWTRWQNTPFTTFTRGALGQPETWAGVEADPGLVATLSGTLLPTSANKADANGVNVEPSFQTAYFRFGPQDQRIHQLFLGYEIEGGEALNMVQGVQVDATGGNFWIGTTDDVLQVQQPFDADQGQMQAAMDIIYGAGVVVATVVAGGWEFEFLSTPPFNIDVLDISLTGGASTVTWSLLTPASPATTLDVDFATDPRADPDFDSYNSDLVSLEPRDIHGVLDDGYHWKPVPVRAQAPGVAVRVRQTGASSKTAIHGLGSEQQPFPSYSQR